MGEDSSRYERSIYHPPYRKYPQAGKTGDVGDVGQDLTIAFILKIVSSIWLLYLAIVLSKLNTSIVDAANGNVAVTLDSANTANIKAGRYLFDVKQVDSANGVTRLFEGIVTVNPQVTK